MKKRRVASWMVVLSLLVVVATIAGGGFVYAASRSKPAADVSDDGIVIAAVEADSPADEAGVVRGDILLQIDDQELDAPGDLLRYLQDLEPGDQVELTVLHGDNERRLTATLGEQNGRSYLGLAACGGFYGARALDFVPENLGAIITQVMPDSPADEAGLLEGDRIVAVDGQELDEDHNLADLIAAYEPGDTVTLGVERPGEESREVTVELGEHPEEEGTAYLGVRYLPLPRFKVFEGEDMPFRRFFGRRFSDVPPFDFDFGRPDVDEAPFEFPPDVEVQQGAIILRVADDSPAAEAGLRKGDVIAAVAGEPVENPQDLVDAVAEREPSDELALTVHRSGEEDALEVEVTLAENPEKEGAAYLGVSLGGYYRGFFRGGMIGPRGNESPRWFFDWDELPFNQNDQGNWRPFRFRGRLNEFFDTLPFGPEGVPGGFEFRSPFDLRDDEPCCSDDNVL